MRKSTLAAALVAVALAAVGCSSATATPTPPPDAQAVMAAASKASYPSRVEITVGGSYTTGAATISLPDNMVTVDLDTSAGKGSVHLAVPASLLGGALAGLGVTGDTLTVDLLYDGAALYAKSPALPALVSQLSVLAPGSSMPPLTADTWAKLIDEATMKQLMASAGSAVGSAVPSLPAAPSAAADMQTTLDQIGATLTLGPQTTGPGGPANDVKVTVDPAKLQAFLAAHPQQLPTGQIPGLSSLPSLDQLSSLSADVLVDAATSRVEQVTLTAGMTQNGSTSSAAIKVGIGEAPSSVTFATPSGAVDLPLMQILGPVVSNMLGGSGLPIPSANP